MYMKLKFEARYPCVCRKVGEKKEWRDGFDGFKMKVVVLGGAHHKVERILSPQPQAVVVKLPLFVEGFFA